MKKSALLCILACSTLQASHPRDWIAPLRAGVFFPTSHATQKLFSHGWVEGEAEFTYRFAGHWGVWGNAGYSYKSGHYHLRHKAHIELMPVSTSEVLNENNFMPIAEAKRAIESHYGDLIPEPSFHTNGPAIYYQIPGRQQRVGFIGAMTNLHFCESCNKLRLTCDGKLRPCLGSALEFDILKPLRAGASDAELR